MASKREPIDMCAIAAGAAFALIVGGFFVAMLWIAGAGVGAG